jgi:virginiamycin A acetyltransferase
MPLTTDWREFSSREAAKIMVMAIALVMVAPFAGLERLLRGCFKRDVLFLGQGEALSLVPAKFGRYLRNAYYYFTLRRCPLDCCFMMGVTFTHSEAEVGHRLYIGAYSLIGMVDIGDDTMISDHVHLLSGKNQHGSSNPDLPFQQQPQAFIRISIGQNTWIGANAVVMADVGSQCVVGAASVVTHPIPDFSVAVGTPAKVIKSTKKPQALGRDAHGSA